MAKVFILACDGGGVRGYITASVLQKLLNSAGVGDFSKQVTLRAGTSTGSFIALGLAAGLPISTILQQYQQQNAKRIFTPNNGSAAQGQVPSSAGPASRWVNGEGNYNSGVLDTYYTNTGAISVAQELLGSTTTLSQLEPLMVNTVQLDDEGRWSPLNISNIGRSPYGSMLAYEAAMCSGSAPIYFPPFSPSSVALGYCVDGGLFANNPSLAAIASAMAAGVEPSDLYVLSFDTGTTQNGMSSQIIEQIFGGASNMGIVNWLAPLTESRGGTNMPKFPLLSVMMDATSEAITAQSQAILGANYLRVSVPMTASVALDDTSDSAYQTMDSALQAYIASPAFARTVTWIRNNFPS